MKILSMICFVFISNEYEFSHLKEALVYSETVYWIFKLIYQ